MLSRGQEEKGTTEDEMAGWHHWLDGPESEWTLGVGDGQGGLACWVSWGLKETDTTEPLNWTELILKKNYINDPDNHDSVVTHLKQVILECEVKWTLESITINKASGGDGILIEPFQVLKDDAVKVLHPLYQEIWKTQ